MKRLRRKQDACARNRFLPIVERLEERVLLTIPVIPPGLSGGLIATAVGANGQNPGRGAISATGVRYADGAVAVSAADLTTGFARFDRVWTNNAAYAAGAFNGSGWVDTQLPYLQNPNGNSTTIVVLSGGTDARFFDLNGSAYQERLFLPEQLTSGSNQFTLTDSMGDQIVFNDFSSNWPASKQGQFSSSIDPGGNAISVTDYYASGNIKELRETTGSVFLSYLFSYNAGGLLTNVILRRSLNSGSSWSTVQQASYVYYDGIAPWGNAGDLKMAQTQDSSGAILDTHYYRYYLSGDPNGPQHALKYVFNPDSYARLQVAFPDPTTTTASDALVAVYADDCFRYDSQGRVKEQDVQGAGASSSGGIGTFTYAYSPSSNPAGTNSWQVKTTVTLPDTLNQQIVYTNSDGEPMLNVFHDAATNNNWENFTKYDTAGRIVLTANPSALSGYSDSYADLLHSQGFNYQYMRPASGLVNVFDYYTSTNATPDVAGGVAGYERDVQVQQGQLFPIMLNAAAYTLHANNGINVFRPGSTTLYRTGGGGPETTTYSYSWFSNSFQPQVVTVNMPSISSGQNGPGSADTETTYFDSFGNAIWHKDGAGFITYTAYDTATGAVVTSIADVDMTQTSEFQNPPTGWSTPYGGGLNLISQMKVDPLGRDTKVTDPKGNITYIRWDDFHHAERIYPAWNPGNPPSNPARPTGPTQV
jgi:hypothetical protein